MCSRLILVTVMFAGIPIAAAGQEVKEPPSKVLTALAATYVGLNALDVVTTEHAILSGRGQEANPVMAPLTRDPYAFALTKAATTAATVMIARRIARKHRVAAVVFWVAADVGLGLVVAHNARVGAP